MWDRVGRTMASKPPPAKDSARTVALPANAQARQTARIGLAIALVLLSVWVAWEFIAPLGWAAVITLTTWPAYRKFVQLIPAAPSSVIAPLLFTLILGVVLFIPIAFALHQFAQESQVLAKALAHYRQNGIPVPELLAKIPWSEHAIRWWSANLSEPAVAAEWLGGRNDTQSDIAWTRSLGGQFVYRLFLFFTALMGVFVLLRSGAWIGDRVLETADRLLGDPGERLASKMAETIRGIVHGTVTVAIAEGLIIGFGYFAAGVPNPLLLSLLTMAFAMVPLGAWVVFTGAALLLLLQGGSLLAAAGVVGFGAVVMVIGDTVIWPALVGNRARLPFLVALIGIFGGLQAFGLIGLFVGPMILGALWTVWREWVVPPKSAIVR